MYNNYIEATNIRKPSGASSSLTGGINVMNGVLNSKLSGYYQVKNAQIVNNTFVNCDYALRIGTNKGVDNDQEPINLIVANNIMYNTSTAAYEIVTSPSGNSPSEGNMTNLAANSMLDDGNFHRLTSESAAINAGVGNYSFLTHDILGGARSTSFDAGAEEFGASGNRMPFTASDVDVTVGFGATYNGSLGTRETSFIDQGIALFPIPTKGRKLTITSVQEPITLVEIYSIKGEKVLTSRGNTKHLINIDVEALSAGIYYIKINSFAPRKFIVR